MMNFTIGYSKLPFSTNVQDYLRSLEYLSCSFRLKPPSKKVVQLKMSTPKRKVSSVQLDLMVDFIKENRVMLHGKTKPTEAGAVEKLWEELSEILNSVGSGPTKNQLQWKKTFIDWKCKTRKKARENLIHQQRTGGGEAEDSNLTPAEEKLMSLLSWVTVVGVDVEEAGLQDAASEARSEDMKNEEEAGVVLGNDLSNLEGVPSTSHATPSLKRRAPHHSLGSAKRVKVSKGSSNLQKAAEAYAVGQKYSADILGKLLEVTTRNSDPEERELRKKELELKEAELKLKYFELKLKERELDLLEKQQSQQR